MNHVHNFYCEVTMPPEIARCVLLVAASSSSRWYGKLLMESVAIPLGIW